MAGLVAEKEEQKLDDARLAIQTDPNIQELVERFDAKVDDKSIAPNSDS